MFLVSNNAGPVVVKNSVDLSLSITENEAVTIAGNTFTDVNVTKNSGGVTINNNTAETLSCADNNPAPTGSGNMIAFADGQCAGF